jgi:hypothetical protein
MKEKSRPSAAFDGFAEQGVEISGPEVHDFSAEARMRRQAALRDPSPKEGLGNHLRDPALSKPAIEYRGHRFHQTPAGSHRPYSACMFCGLEVMPGSTVEPCKKSGAAAVPAPTMELLQEKLDRLEEGVTQLLARPARPVRPWFRTSTSKSTS